MSDFPFKESTVFLFFFLMILGFILLGLAIFEMTLVIALSSFFLSTVIDVAFLGFYSSVADACTVLTPATDVGNFWNRYDASVSSINVSADGKNSLKRDMLGSFFTFDCLPDSFRMVVSDSGRLCLEEGDAAYE